LRTRRILFSICMVLLLVCGLYSGERIYFVGFAMLLMALILSLLSVLFASVTFKYVQALSPAMGVKGDTVEYKVEVHNEILFPIPYISLQYDSIDSLLNGAGADVTLSLLPQTHGERREVIFCRYRGRWNVGLKSVVIRDFFGLVSVKLDVSKFLNHKKLSLLVRPRIINLERLPMRRKNDEGPMEAAPRRSEDIAMFSDIRKYLQGDQMKKIHWKLTARQRELMVKNYEETSLPDLLLYMDTRARKLELFDKLNLEDTLVECATAVVHYLLENHMPTSLIYYGEKRLHLHGSRPEHFQAFYSVLGEMPFDGKWAPEDVLMNDLKLITRSGNIFLITCAISNKLYDLLMLMNNTATNITMIFVYEPCQDGGMTEMRAMELGRTKRMMSEMRNVGITVIDLNPGENIAERMSMLR
jgi:uncharacterized protein (DUF58 family)